MIRLIILTIALTANMAFAQSSFVSLPLPQNVSIELPKNWIVATENTRITAEAFAESLGGHKNTDLKFLAESYDQQNHRIANVNVVYLPNAPPLSQSELRAFTQSEFESNTKGLQGQINEVIKKVGGRLLSWEKPKRVEINGVTLMELGYSTIVPSTGEGVFKVKMLHMFAGPKSFKLTIGYSVDRALVLEPITNHIINSLKQK